MQCRGILVDLERPPNICRLPSTWTMRKATIITPVTAITAFFPIDECQNRAIAPRGTRERGIAAADGAVIADVDTR